MNETAAAVSNKKIIHNKIQNKQGTNEGRSAVSEDGTEDSAACVKHVQPQQTV